MKILSKTAAIVVGLAFGILVLWASHAACSGPDVEAGKSALSHVCKNPG